MKPVGWNLNEIPEGGLLHFAGTLLEVLQGWINCMDRNSQSSNPRKVSDSKLMTSQPCIGGCKKTL